MPHNKKYFTRFVCECQYKISRIIIFYAGGHLGFSKEQLADIKHMDYDSEIKEIINCTKTYEEKFKKHIPVIVAGGVFTHEDVMHCMELGADGVQVASRFVATEECDASDAYKQPITKCYNCLEKCNPAKAPYCITKALIAAVKGDMQNGLVFCGANVGHINRITTVHELMSELVGA